MLTKLNARLSCSKVNYKSLVKKARYLLVSSVIAVAGCSDDGVSETTTNQFDINVQVGQNDFQDTLIRVSAINSSGEAAQDNDGRSIISQNVSQTTGRSTIVLGSSQSLVFQSIGVESPAQSRRTCQLVNGCDQDNNSATENTDFGDSYSVVGQPGWRSTAINPEANQQFLISPFTELITELAAQATYEYQDNANGQWILSGVLSLVSVEQAASQLNQMFGVDDLLNRLPADLTDLEPWTLVEANSARNSVRYGALMAAIQQQELALGSNSDFYHAQLAAELLSSDNKEVGQLTFNTLRLLLESARDNLSAISNLSTAADELRNEVVAGFVTSLGAVTAAENAGNSATDIAPATIEQLLADTDLSDFQTGIQRTKAFVDTLRTDISNLFSDDYKNVLDAYGEELKTIGNRHQPALQTMIDRYIAAYKRYRVCVNEATCPEDNYDSDTKTLVIDEVDTQLTIAQRVVDINTTDDIDAPTESKAIDVTITGQLTEQGVTLVLTDRTDSEGAVTENAALRVFHSTAVSELTDVESENILGYQLRWSEFDLSVEAAEATVDQPATEAAQLTGRFTLLYRAVDDPNGIESARFNIESVTLTSSELTNAVNADEDSDINSTSLSVSALATNADKVFPESDFASFNGFFKPQQAENVPAEITDLLTVAQSTATIKEQDVSIVDVTNNGTSETTRYRFYPTKDREDVFDSDSDGDRDELVASHDFERCDVATDGSVSCQPSIRLFRARDVQESLNELWESGELSEIEIPGQGQYFVTWEASENSDGCFKLDALSETEFSLQGSLIQSDVVGLSSATITGSIQLAEDQPSTFVSATVSAPTQDEVSFTAAISHDHDNLVATTSNVFIGDGESADVLVVSYDSQSKLSDSGSILFIQNGTTLQLDEETTDVVDVEFLATGKLSPTRTLKPFKFIINNEGDDELCVTSNEKSLPIARELTDAEFVLTFRGVIYGRVKQENGQWLIRYTDGSFESLQ